MKSLPLPIRVAAGLAVTAVEQARTLPAKIAGLPVTVASQALQVSMRVQQQVTELAIRGDEVLASFRPVEDTPEWATFDEDVEDDQFDRGKSGPFESAFDRVDDESERHNGHHTASVETFATPDPWTQEEQALAEESGAHEDDLAEDDLAEDDLAEAALTEAAGAEADLAGTGADLAGAEPDLAGADVTGGDVTGDDVTVADVAGGDVTGGDVVGGEALGDDVSEGDVLGVGDRGDDRPLPEATGYDQLSLPQLRARLRRYTVDELAELLEYERAHGNRPSFVGMLTRRIATVRDQR